MSTTTHLLQAQYRLARHYLNRLRTADAAVRRGEVSVSYGTALFDQEWEQIRHWQGWAARHERSDEERTRLCKEFPLAGLEILLARNNAADHADWLVTALEAARQLGDREAERTLCFQLVMTNYRLGVPEKLEYYASELLRLGEAADDTLSIERALFGFGLAAEEGGRFAEAESYYERALQISLELGIDSEIGQALNGLGTVATYMGDYQKAYPYFLQQLELMDATGKKSEVCHALLSMGGVLLWQKDYTAAEQYLQRAVTMSRALGLRRLFGVSLIHLGAAALRQNHLETAHRYLEEGLEAVRSVGIVRQIMSGLSLLGDTSLRMGKPATALDYLQEGLQMARQAKSPRLTCNLQCDLVKTYLALNDLDSALDALKEALSLARSLGGHPPQVEAVSVALLYCQLLGLNEQAAIWAGAIRDDPEVDQHLFAQLCGHLERALGTEVYQQALGRGKWIPLEDVVNQMIEMIAHDKTVL